MKLIALMSAGLVAVAAMAPAAASAQVHQEHARVVTRTVTHTEHRGGYNNHRTRKVCRSEWRNHHKVRICRTVRR